MQGNPVSLTDPFGLSPDISWKGVGHALLDVLGFIPIVGDAFDIVNAVWYASEGNYLEAASCVVSALPGIGSFVGNGIKRGFKGAKTATKVADGIILTTRIASNTTTLARGGYGVYVSGRQIYTDIKDGRSVSFGDALRLGLNVATVGLSAKSLKSNISLGRDYIKQVKQRDISRHKTKGMPKTGASGKEVSSTGYHVTKTEYAESIVKNGFRESTSGRADGGGVYVNNTPEGAFAEFSKYNPPGTPNTMLTVKYNPGVNVMIENPGTHIKGPLPIFGDTLTFKSTQLPRAYNTIVRNGTIVIQNKE